MEFAVNAPKTDSAYESTNYRGKDARDILAEADAELAQTRIDNAFRCSVDMKPSELKKLNEVISPIVAIPSQEAVRNHNVSSHPIPAVMTEICQDKLQRFGAEEIGENMAITARSIDTTKIRHMPCMAMSAREDFRVVKAILGTTDYDKRMQNYLTQGCCTLGAENCYHHTTKLACNNVLFWLNIDALFKLFHNKSVKMMRAAMLFPLGLMEDHDCYDQMTGINVRHENGKTIMWFEGDNSTPYVHETETWRTYYTAGIKSGKKYGYGFNLVFEISSRIGRMCIIDIVRTYNAATICRIPARNTETVTIANWLPAMATIGSKLSMEWFGRIALSEKDIVAIFTNCKRFKIPRTMLAEIDAFLFNRKDDNIDRQSAGAILSSKMYKIIVGEYTLQQGYTTYAADYSTLVILLLIRAYVVRQFATKVVSYAANNIVKRTTLKGLFGSLMELAFGPSVDKNFTKTAWSQWRIAGDFANKIMGTNRRHMLFQKLLMETEKPAEEVIWEHAYEFKSHDLIAVPPEQDYVYDPVSDGNCYAKVVYKAGGVTNLRNNPAAALVNNDIVDRGYGSLGIQIENGHATLHTTTSEFCSHNTSKNVYIDDLPGEVRDITERCDRRWQNNHGKENVHKTKRALLLLGRTDVLNMCANPANDEHVWQELSKKFKVWHYFDTRYFQGNILPQYPSHHSRDMDKNVFCTMCMRGIHNVGIFADLGSDLQKRHLSMYYRTAMQCLRATDNSGVVLKVANFRHIMESGVNKLFLQELDRYWNVHYCEELQANEVYLTLKMGYDEFLSDIIWPEEEKEETEEEKKEDEEKKDKPDDDGKEEGEKKGGSEEGDKPGPPPDDEKKEDPKKEEEDDWGLGTGMCFSLCDLFNTDKDYTPSAPPEENLTPSAPPLDFVNHGNLTLNPNGANVTFSATAKADEVIDVTVTPLEPEVEEKAQEPVKENQDVGATDAIRKTGAIPKIMKKESALPKPKTRQEVKNPVHSSWVDEIEAEEKKAQLNTGESKKEKATTMTRVSAPTEKINGLTLQEHATQVQNMQMQVKLAALKQLPELIGCDYNVKTLEEFDLKNHHLYGKISNRCVMSRQGGEWELRNFAVEYSRERNNLFNIPLKTAVPKAEFAAIPFDGYVVDVVGGMVQGPLYERKYVEFEAAEVAVSKLNTNPLSSLKRDLENTRDKRFKDFHKSAATKIDVKAKPKTNKIKLIDATYCSGKSHYVREYVDEHLACGNNRDASYMVVCPSSALAKEFKDQGYNAVSWSGFINHFDPEKHDTLFIDEIFLQDPRVVYYALTVCENVFAVGDRNQMAPDLVICKHWDLRDNITKTHRLEISLNTPLDIVYTMNMRDSTEVRSRSRIVSSIEIRELRKVEDVKRCPTQCEKEHEHDRVYCFDVKTSERLNCQTIAAIQGLRVKQMNLVVTPSSKMLIDRVKGQLLVAMTRATEKLIIYYTTCSRNLAKKMQGIVPYGRVGARGEFRTVYGESETLNTRFEVKKTAVTFSMDRKEAENITENTEYSLRPQWQNARTGDITFKVPSNYAVNQSTAQRPLLDVEHVQGDIGFERDILDEMIPEEPIFAEKLDTINHHDPLQASLALQEIAPTCSEIAQGNRKVNILRTRQPKRRMQIRTTDPLVDTSMSKQSVMMSSVFATSQFNNNNHKLNTAIERYGVVDRKHMSQKEEDEEFEALVEGFSKFVEVSALRAPTLEEYDTVRAQALIRVCDKSNQKETGYYGEVWGTTEQIKCFNKEQQKCKIGDNYWCNVKEDEGFLYVKGGQMVSAQPKEVNQICSPHVNWAERCVMGALIPQCKFGYGYNAKSLRRHIKKRVPVGEKLDTVSIDIKEQDTTKSSATDRFMRWIYTSCGVPENVIDAMEKPNVNWIMDNRLAKIRVHNQFQSGRADTLFANTCHLMGVVGKNIDFEGLMAAMMQGDDFWAIAEQITVKEEHDKCLKIDKNPVGEFVGYVIIGNHLTLDLPRIVAKTLSKTFVDKERLEELQTAVRDLMSMIKTQEQLEIAYQGLALKYQCSEGDIAMMYNFLKSFASEDSASNYLSLSRKSVNASTIAAIVHYDFEGIGN